MVSRYKGIKINGKKYDEHRWMMEQHLGRKLNRDEVVHHKNENKRDNFIENFEVQSLSEHTSNFMKKYMNSPKGRQMARDNGKKYGFQTSKFKKGKYWCPRCKKWLLKEDFYKSTYPNNLYGIRTNCKICDLKKSKERRLKNEKILRTRSNKAS